MSGLLWLGLSVAVILATGIWLSFHYTSRRPRTVFHTAAEYGLEGEEVTFKASDGLELRGCWIPARRSPVPAVIILHGHGGSLDTDLHRAPAFHEAGFSVFLFDFRAHGASRGRIASFGYLERRDVMGAVAYVRGRGAEKVGLLGFSYGGIAAMLSAPLCPDVYAVASDGGPARMRSAIQGRGYEWRVPRWFSSFIAWLIVVITSLRLRANLFRYDAVRWVGRIAPRPILIIHGEDDPYLRDFDDLWNAAAEPKEAWRLPGVGHTKASEMFPEDFERRVIGFFKKNLA
jgi:pimeloyl-ACP methyl ester carboxylesterase